MTTIVNFRTSDGQPFYVEVADGSEGSDGTIRRGLHPAEITEQAAESFDTLVERIHGPITAVLGAFQNAADDVDEVELGFALTVRADAGIVVSKIGGEANFHVTVKWTRPRPKDPPG